MGCLFEDINLYIPTRLPLPHSLSSSCHFPIQVPPLSTESADNLISSKMSGAARRRGGRGRPDNTSDASSRRSLGNPAAPPGGFDGPASRGSASGPGSAGRGRGQSNPPSAAESAADSQPTSPGVAQTGLASTPTPQAGSQPDSRAGASPASQMPIRTDPARDNPPSYFDHMKNIDLPPSFYNFDREVCRSAGFLVLLHYCFTSLLSWSPNA